MKRASIYNVIESTIHGDDRGSALVWSLVFIVGLSAIGWAATQVVMPRFEKKQRTLSVRALTSVNRDPVSMRLEGFTATLRGEVVDEPTRQAMVDSLGFRTGVFRVDDQLRVVEQNEPEQPLVIDDLFAAFMPPSVTPDVNDVPVPLRRINATQESDAEALAGVQADIETGVQADNETEEEILAEASTVTAAETGTIERSNASASGPSGIADLPPTMPSLSIRVAGDVLAVEGALSVNDNPSAVIRRALDELSLDVVSNAIRFSDDIQPAPWLASLESLIPLVATLADPQLDIVQSQVSLSGVAPDQAAHDNIINEASTQLDTFSLVERISIAPPDTSIEVPRNTPLQTEIATVDAFDISSNDVSLSNNDDQVDDDPADDNLVDNNTTDDNLLFPPEDTVEQSSVARAQDTQLNLPASIALRQALNVLSTRRVRFESGSDVLTPESAEVLDTIATVFIDQPEVSISIEGHTDSVGDASANIALSLARATSVRKYLIERGVSAFRLQARGFGEQVPIADNETLQGRATNRRIEFNF